MDNSELRYSEDALINRIVFSGDQHHINIVVEDYDKEYIYEEIFKRLFASEYKVGVFAGNGKVSVKSIYSEFGEKCSHNGRIKLLYLMDGDFDRYIKLDSMLTDRCCVYLDAYNIESYFIDEDAINSFVKGKLKCCDNDLKEKLQFSQWLNRIILEAKDLFFLYCYIQKHFATHSNVSFSQYRFIDEKCGFEKEFSLATELKEKYELLDPNLIENISEIKQSYELFYGNNYFNLICGKFLLTSLYCYIRSLLKAAKRSNAFKYEELEWHLVLNFDIAKLKFIKDTAVNIICP